MFVTLMLLEQTVLVTYFTFSFTALEFISHEPLYNVNTHSLCNTMKPLDKYFVWATNILSWELLTSVLQKTDCFVCVSFIDTKVQ